MRRSLLALTSTLAASSLAACAMLSGLDGITETDCAPHGCADAAGALDAPGGDAEPADSAPSGDDAAARDGGLPWLDAAADTAPAPDAHTNAPDGAFSDGASSDSGEDDDGGDDHHDASSTEGSAGDGSLDAASTDASTHDASDASTAPDADAAPDSGCGTVYLSDAFDSNAHGWALDSTWAIAPTCASPPAPQKGHPDPTTDHTASAAGGGVVAAFACGNNPSGTTAAARYATSPAVDVSAAPSLKLAFWRWLNSDAAGWMTSTVDVYDGAAWVNLYTNPSGAGNIVADASWSRVEYDVTAYKNAAFRVRFGYAINSASVYAMSCWNVDDVTLSTASCP